MLSWTSACHIWHLLVAVMCGTSLAVFHGTKTWWVSYNAACKAYEICRQSSVFRFELSAHNKRFWLPNFALLAFEGTEAIEAERFGGLLLHCGWLRASTSSSLRM